MKLGLLDVVLVRGRATRRAHCADDVRGYQVNLGGIRVRDMSVMDGTDAANTLMTSVTYRTRASLKLVVHALLYTCRNFTYVVTSHTCIFCYWLNSTCPCLFTYAVMSRVFVFAVFFFYFLLTL